MEWQLLWIAWLQQHSALTQIMKWFTFLGNEEFFLLMIPFVYLCIDARLGIRVGLIVLFGDALNTLLKLCFHLPRPYWVQPGLQIGHDTSYGLPSSHAQNAASVWLFLARVVRSTWAWVAAILLILLISLSRVFLGVHFFTDIIGGWLIGILFLLFFLRLEPALRRWFAGLTFWSQVATICVGTAVLIICGFAVRAAVAGTPDPAAWAQFSEEARGLEALMSRAGGLFGLGIGVILARRSARFDARGPVPLRLARFLIGVLGLLILWIGLGKLFPREPETVGLIFRFIRYALMTWWVAFMAPWLFLKVKLARPEQRISEAVPV